MKSTTTDRLRRVGVVLAWLPIATAAWAQEDGPPDASTMPAALAAAGVQIAIVDDTLTIGGTPKDDRILIKATRHPDTVRVIFNDLRLGQYGPIARIEVDAGDGDDVVLVGGAVELPARLNGGPGNDRLRGGSGPDLVFGDDGDDVLIATFGRDGLDGGPGSNRLVVRRPMGEIHVGASAASDALRILAMAYDLPPLEDALPPSATAPGPIIVGPDELQDDATVDLLSSSYQAGHTIALAGAEATHAELLAGLLGHASGASWDPEIPQVDLIAYRTAIRPDGGTHESTSILLPPRQAAEQEAELPRAEARRARRAADMFAVEALSGVFSGTPVLADSEGVCTNVPAEQCLQRLANSYAAKTLSRNSQFPNLQIQIQNNVWAARSFQNQEDLYYVFQEVDYNGLTVPLPDIDAPAPWEVTPDNFMLAPGVVPGMFPTIIQPSPETTQKVTEVTSGVSESLGGSVGYDQTQGLNATLSGGLTIQNSTTKIVPPTVVINQSDLETGEVQWIKEVEGFVAINVRTTVTFFNQWIWEVPFTAYSTGQPCTTSTGQPCTTSTGQPCIAYASSSNFHIASTPDTWDTVAIMSPKVPVPFGDTFALQQPAVTSVDPTSVSVGDEFTIRGTAFYPSLVNAVVIGGNSLAPTQFSTVSDTEISVVAPDTPGDSQPVVVQTQEGNSGDTVTIDITDTLASPAGRTASEAVVPGPEG